MLRTLNLQASLRSVDLQPRLIASSFKPRYLAGVRHIHNETSQSPLTQPRTTSSPAGTASQSRPLSILPLSAVARNFLIAGVSSNPMLLTPSLAALECITDSKSSLLHPDRNPALKYILSKTIYTQFCGGETPAEIRQTVKDLKDFGYAGVMLGYSREAVMTEEEAAAISSSNDAGEAFERENNLKLTSWRDGILHTIDIVGTGDFVAIKFTGAGEQALKHLLNGDLPAPALHKAIHEICRRAKDRKVRIFIDAEQQAIQPTIDAWTLDLQSKYNQKDDGPAVVYGTYQAYLRSTPENLSKHLAIAQTEGFILGVKLVRGAYLGSDPRHLIWDRKEHTDRMYDGIAESVMRRRYGDILKPHHLSSTSSSNHVKFPEVNLVLASHNRTSVNRARSIRNEQFRNGDNMIEMAYGQLLGMADDISCDLVHDGRVHNNGPMTDINIEIPKVYKSLVWGKVGACSEYLLRRAQENQDAAARTGDTRKAMARELKRRLLQGA